MAPKFGDISRTHTSRDQHYNRAKHKIQSKIGQLEYYVIINTDKIRRTSGIVMAKNLDSPAVPAQCEAA